MANKKGRSAARKKPNMKVILIAVGVLLAIGLISSIGGKKEEPAASATQFIQPTLAPTVEPMPTAAIITSKPTKTPTAAPTDIPTLSKGSTGSAVRELQQRLIDLGYLKGKADGDYGAKTVQAVKDYQVVHNLTEDGVAGPKTITAIFGYSHVNTTVYVSTNNIYHSKSDCSGMKNPKNMSLVDAIRNGCERCQRCH